jgi:hypothetical protein
MKIKIMDIAVKAGGVTAGAVLAKVSNRFLGTLNPKLRAVGKIVIGAVVPAVMPKSKIADHVGTGVMAVGAAELFEEFVPSNVAGNDGVMNGAVGAPVTIDEDFVSGPDDDMDDEVSGADDDIMSGTDDEDDLD